MAEYRDKKMHKTEDELYMIVWQGLYLGIRIQDVKAALKNVKQNVMSLPELELLAEGIYQKDFLGLTINVNASLEGNQ